MSTNASQTVTESKVETKSAKPIDKGAEIRAKAKVEAFSFTESIKALIESGSKLGALAIDELATSVGESANKMGKPSETPYLALVVALSHQSGLTYGRRSELMRKANAATPLGHKPVAVIKAKASADRGAASYRLNAPVALDIALGE